MKKKKKNGKIEFWPDRIVTIISRGSVSGSRFRVRCNHVLFLRVVCGREFFSGTLTAIENELRRNEWSRQAATGLFIPEICIRDDRR